MEIGEIPVIGNIIGGLTGANNDEPTYAEELSQKLKSPEAQQFVEELAAKIIEMRDSNGDGALSEVEMGLPGQLFDKFDTNADKYLDQEEIAIQASKVKDSIPEIANLLGSSINKLPSPEQIKEIIENFNNVRAAK